MNKFQINRFIEKLARSVKRYTGKYMYMTSGAGHDSQIFAPFLETAMLFIPSHLGYSHRPDEFTDEQCMIDATHILCDFLQNSSH